jgi:hypothetical protein
MAAMADIKDFKEVSRFLVGLQLSHFEPLWWWWCCAAASAIYRQTLKTTRQVCYCFEKIRARVRSKFILWKLFNFAAPWRWTDRISRTTKQYSCWITHRSLITAATTLTNSTFPNREYPVLFLWHPSTSPYGRVVSKQPSSTAGSSGTFIPLENWSVLDDIIIGIYLLCLWFFVHRFLLLSATLRLIGSTHGASPNKI